MQRRQLFVQQENNAEVNMTPMLDVVFIMLIFFIVSTSFIREAGIEVNRPSASTGRTQSKSAVMVAISPNNEIWIDRRMVDLRMVRPVIERIKSEQAEVTVVVQADAQVTSGKLIALLDQLRLAQVRYTVATQDDNA